MFSAVKSRFARSRWAASVATITILGSILVPLTAAPAAATDPSHVSFTLEGCRGSVGSFPANGPFVCADDEYTTGNLGSGWNELDLVPHRLTADATNAAPATQTYTIAIVADSFDGGHPGYDVISVPVLNTDLSDASCTAPTVSAQQTASPGVGGTDESIYRFVTITQEGGTTCVYDYYERLALGSHLYPGSSLHSNLTNEDLETAGIGARDVSIPVKEIQPQSINKTMTASQGSDHIWLLSKSPSPATLNFADTCAGTTGALQQNVAVTITWTKQAATPSGDINVITEVFATNPAHRVITVNVTDEIRSGTTVLDTANSGDVDVPANTANFLVLHHETTVPAGTTNLNDVATATYIDKITGIPVPGTTTATASATPTNTGPELNQTAVITDTESITGTGLTFSVATPSVGSFTGGYVAGTPTTGPVGWSSGTQSGSGSVTFNKTVYVDEPRITSGTLSDTATLTGSDGFTASANASVAITTSATTTLTIEKTIPNVLTGSETATFNFVVASGSSCTDDGSDGCTNEVDTASITFTAGETTDSVDVTGLAPGTYTVHEKAATGWATQSDQAVTITLPSCAETVTFNNTFAPASARVRKVTIPAGSEAGWEFTLTGPGTPPGGEVVTTTGTGFVVFTTVLEEGSYTITETDGPSGWDQTGTSGDCSFTVDFPADAGRTFSCTFTNTQRGSVTVIKTQNGGVPTLGYTFCLSGGPDNLPTTNCLTTNATNGGTLAFGDVPPGDYTLCEKAVPAGTDSTLVDQGGVLDPNTGDVCLDFTLDPGEDRVFNVDNAFPLGGQRTIGYWKNWNICSGHASVAKAQRTGNHLLEEFLPQHLGPYNVDTCAKAVAVLKVSSMKYAENGTAAQLLGAKLNVAAGAGTCPAILTAIQTADNLLTAINYDGPAGQQVVGSSHPLRSQFNAVHATLDAYNNGELC